MLQGVNERFPGLKFVFQESGLFWVPMIQYRLDEVSPEAPGGSAAAEISSSEYIKEYFYFGTQPIEAPKNMKHLEAVFEAADGFKHFVYCSDYPHFDFDDPQAILRLSFLTSDQKADVLGRNALDLFKLRKSGRQPWEDNATTGVAVAAQ